MTINFFILTRGRVGRQITLSNLPRSIRKKTYLVVEKDEYQEHRGEKMHDIAGILKFQKQWGNFVLDGSGNFSDKKQWTAEYCLKKDIRYMVLLDDDLKFDARKEGKLKPAKNKDVVKAFKQLHEWMKDGFAHVALSAREGNNWVEEDYIEVGRAMRVCGFDVKVLEKHNLKLNRTILMGDFDITLQLLELGYTNRILYSHANGQRKSNDEGGCSLYRTPEKMTEAANILKVLHPKFVTVKQVKTSKPWAGFDTKVRTDVQVSWKKAYEYGVSKKKLSKFF
ncbi:MAG TPA: hypothetical protein VMX17_01255 [Candidatus Glassbacteria bacterium]|nr:hypothetical protein [Candidatus Glassbacteria bacterium]